MPTHVALLRGINVGGRNLVAMSLLRDLFGAMGFTNVKSLLQSGNLVFHSDARSVAALEQQLEKETSARLNVSADYLVRTGEDWDKIIATNPFPKEAKSDPSHLIVTFLKEEAKPEDVKFLQAAIKGPERLRAEGKHLYIVYPAGIGRSKLTNVLVERKLGTRGTARNWNTVLKLGVLMQG